MIFSILIFVITYIFIASEKIHKTLAALLGASAMIILHIIDENKAFEHIDMNVIFLLGSMMILVKVIEKTGIFQYIAIKFAKKTKGNPIAIMIILFFITAIFSSILDNITTVLLLAPISILIAGELGISPMPFLLTQIFASNIGGTATLIGDPPNIMIGSAAHLTFGEFIINLFPIIFINLIVFSVVAYFLFRKKMVVTNDNRAKIMDFDETKFFNDKSLLIKSCIVFGLLLVGFAIHGFIDLEASSIALTAATILLIITKTDPDTILKEVEWGTIFFFIGLFIIVGALVENGVIALISSKMIEFTHSDIKLTAQIIIWFSAIFSAVVDNIPFVATMIPIIKTMGINFSPHIMEPIWWSLSLGSCLGGNGTLIGASANIIVVGFAKRAGYPISFMSFLKYSIPITLMTITISYFYIMLRYF